MKLNFVNPENVPHVSTYQVKTKSSLYGTTVPQTVSKLVNMMFKLHVK